MNEKTMKLIELIKENPDLEVLPMVNSECVEEDSSCYWVAKWSDCSIEEVYEDEKKERIYVKSSDVIELIEDRIDQLTEFLSATEFYETLGYFESQAEKEIENLNWKKVILVYIDARQ